MLYWWIFLRIEGRTGRSSCQSSSAGRRRVVEGSYRRNDSKTKSCRAAVSGKQTHTHTHTHDLTGDHRHAHTHTNTNTHTYTHIHHTHPHAHTHMHTNTHTHTHTHKRALGFMCRSIPSTAASSLLSFFLSSGFKLSILFYSSLLSSFSSLLSLISI